MIKKAIFLCCAIVSFCIEIKAAKKQWTIMVYMAADNDLEVFVDYNLKQMIKIGSNENVNIIAQANTYENRYQRKSAKTIYIEKNSKKIINLLTQQNQTDSGSPKTLIDFCKKTIQEFPAEHYALFFWDHGTGAIEPFINRNLETSDLFLFETNFETLEKGLPDFFDLTVETQKGVCFDDTTGNFLTETKLQAALKAISEECLNGKKIDLIGFDACLMAMVETASAIKDYAHFMVASQEVELGTGWDYKRVLKPFLEKKLTPKEFGQHIVEAYAKSYSFIDDYTLSCIDLASFGALEKMLFELFALFQNMLTQQPHSMFELLQVSRFGHSCTHFNEPDYIDLQHFLKNILKNITFSQLTDTTKKEITQKISSCLVFLKEIIIANKTGNYFYCAEGLSIYFPEHRIHQSYKKNKFAHKTQWFSLLQRYLA